MSLSGKLVVNPRAAHQAAELTCLLEARGARVLFYPCIAIEPPADKGQLVAALEVAAAGAFDWLLLTSANTVWVLAQELARQRLALAGLHVAAVGPATAAVARDALGLEISVVADDHTAEGLLAALPDVAGLRLFLPQAAIARPVLAEALGQAGAEVTAVPAYETVIGTGGEDIPYHLAQGDVDAIAFTSSSTVTNFLHRLVGEGGRRSDLQQVCLASIGPITARTVEDNNLTPTVVPAVYTLPALVEALAVYFAR
jgi:uroporphyrinogen-III synthase